MEFIDYAHQSGLQVSLAEVGVVQGNVWRGSVCLVPNVKLRECLTICLTGAIQKVSHHLRTCRAKTPGAQNGVRVVSDAPGAAVILHTWSVQSSR